MNATGFFKLWLVLALSLALLGAVASPVQADSPPKTLALSPDLFLAPDLPPRANPKNGPIQFQTASPTPGYYETSEYMMGRVAVALILVESDGSRDPNLENWTQLEEEQAIASFEQALDWWDSQNPAAQLSFSLEVHRGVATGYEPLLHSQVEEGLWLTEVLAQLGYSTGSYFERARDMANDLRKEKGSDWAFLAFVLDGSLITATKFSGSNAVAYAYLGGPFLVLIDEPEGWGSQNLDNIAAHEIAHIFYATDADNGEVEYSGYFNGPDDEGLLSLMSGQPVSWWLSPGTRLQIGWQDSDGDGILDPLDTTPAVSLSPYQPSLTDNTMLEYSGSAEEVPYPNRNPWGTGRAVSINSIRGVSYRIDGSPWWQAQASDGAFDSPVEAFTFTTPELSLGVRAVVTLAQNSVGNSSAPSAPDQVTITLIAVDQSRVSTPRTSLDSRQQVAFHAIWAHNGQPLSQGSLWVNNKEVAVDASGWATATVTSPLVGRELYAVTGAKVDEITKFRQEAPPADIIWDRVEITLDTPQFRVDVGTEAPINLSGVYEFDSEPFSGRILLNDVPRKDQVGKFSFQVVGIEDDRYGLTAWVSNELDIIWDRVRIELEAELPRVEVGQDAPLSIQAWYEYDVSPFEGTVFLDRDRVGSALGSVSFGVRSIADPRYGLTAFSVEPVELVFDRLEPQVHTRALLPGRIQVELKLRYAWDGTPVEDALVSSTESLFPHLQGGVYLLRRTTWAPYVSLPLRIEKPGFLPLELTASTPAPGNIAVLVLGVFLAGGGLAVALRRRLKARG